MKFNGNRPTIPFRYLFIIGLAFILLLVIAVPRLLDLNHFATTDETLWLGRGGKFYYALAHHDLTFARNHPGVTVMWAGLASFVLEDPEYKKGRGDAEHAPSLYSLKRRQPDLPLQLLVTGRRILILFNTLVLLTSFLFARQLLGWLPALAGFLLIAFDPFHIALSRVLHLDGTLANLMLLSVLAFLAYLEKRHKIALVVSAVAAGLAWLTKSPGLFLIPFMVLLIVLYRLYRNTEWDKGSWGKILFSDAKVLVVWGAIAALVFVLFWPAMWVNPIGSLRSVIGAALGYAEEGHESAVFFNGQIYPDGQIPDIRFYPISFLWRTTPVTLLGLIAIPFLFFRKKPVSQPEGELWPDSNSASNVATQKWVVVMLLLFAVEFGAFMTIGLKKFDRYIIPSFVFLDLAAGVGLIWLIDWAAHFFRGKWRTAAVCIILLGLIAVQASLAWNTFPYFFSYYNPLLGGGRRAAAMMQIGWGRAWMRQHATSIKNPMRSGCR